MTYVASKIINGKAQVFVKTDDGQEHPVTFVGQKTTIEIMGEQVEGFGSMEDVARLWVKANMPNEIPEALPDEKLWRGIVKFGGDTSFSTSANKPNSSKGW